jgi:phytoene dehydrogenase-like protein
MKLDGKRFDDVIIGAGMAGLAAGIRLAMYDRNVIILEKHNAVGGLNSFYSIEGRKYDVGLHAMTNYVPKGIKGTPLVKLLRQLRIKREQLDLCPQSFSRISFPGVDVRFNNEWSFMESEIIQAFPNQKDPLQNLLKKIGEYDALSLEGKNIPARTVVEEIITNPKLVDMLFCPLCYYGSARENDMDFAQFVILFKSIYLEGFCRPQEGVRTITRELVNKFRSAGGTRKMKMGVSKIIEENGKASNLILEDGSSIYADNIISTAGLVETQRMCSSLSPSSGSENIGQLSFVETITVLNKQPKDLGVNETIVFFNDCEKFTYAKTQDLIDDRSGVICIPNNYQFGENRDLKEGLVRVTALANYEKWKALDITRYQEEKSKAFNVLTEKTHKILPQLKQLHPKMDVIAKDMFTPLTIERFTGHLGGAVYGAPQKSRSGQTHLSNLFIAGTDQGFLGIVGAMLSGISIANRYVLKENGSFN